MSPFDNTIITEAALHCDRHSLKTLDAIHMASIFRVRDSANASGETFAVVVSDQEIIEACQSENILVIDPAEDRAVEQLRNLRA